MRGRDKGRVEAEVTRREKWKSLTCLTRSRAYKWLGISGI